MLRVCIQLRKSREDIEKEKNGIDTLKAHETTLLEFAKENNFIVAAIKRELVSGGSLYSRPDMLSTLEECERGLYDGILCIDIDRLGRAGMKEQGIILDTLKENNVLIITPYKTYDLNIDSDLLHTDIKSFIARQELNLSKKRYKDGKIRSTKDGQYIHGPVPFGYRKVVINKLKTLEIIPEQAEIVEIIFDMYVNQNKGSIFIAKELTKIGAINASGNSNWSTRTIKAMIHNPVYAGFVYHQKRKYKMVNGKYTSSVNKTPLLVKGLHKAIVSYGIYQRAQELASDRYIAPYRTEEELGNGDLTNPLSGLMKCSCGYAMYAKKDNKALRVNCSVSCGSKGTNIKRVEKRITDDMKKYFENLVIDFEQLNEDNNINNDFKKIELIRINIDKKKLQLKRLYDLLEQGIYTNELFLERSKLLNEELNDLQVRCNELELKHNDNNLIQESIKEIPKIQNILDVYETLSTREKNTFLRSIINKITYYKEKDASPDDFQLVYDMKISN